MDVLLPRRLCLYCPPHQFIHYFVEANIIAAATAETLKTLTPDENDQAQG